MLAVTYFKYSTVYTTKFLKEFCGNGNGSLKNFVV